MSKQRNRNAASLAAKSAELAWAAPQVVAHRLAAMSAAGSRPSARDLKEMQTMASEKVLAFSQSWQAIGWELLRLQQAQSMRVLAALATGRPLTSLRPPTAAQALSASMAILGKGLAPVHRKAVANAKRLSGSKSRR
ncbi:MAG: polyhydroxyalkanoate granule-associated phasin [Burkholderiaceae bacterium]